MKRSNTFLDEAHQEPARRTPSWEAARGSPAPLKSEAFSPPACPRQTSAGRLSSKLLVFWAKQTDSKLQFCKPRTLRIFQQFLYTMVRSILNPQTETKRRLRLSGRTQRAV